MHPLIPQDLVLVVILIYALYTDLKSGLIYNHITFPGMAVGLTLNFYLLSGQGLLDGTLGIGLAFLLLYIPYVIGWQGAGDVKLLMAVGALEGWRFVLFAFLLYMIASFVLSMFYILMRVTTKGKAGRDFLTRFGIAISMGMQIDNESDKKILKTDVKWSPAIFGGVILALLILRFFPQSL
jgi:prepilin peptidase CpaA